MHLYKLDDFLLYELLQSRDLLENLHRHTAFSSANFADEREKVFYPSAGLMNANPPASVTVVT